MAKILVVDDDPQARKPLARLLEMEGYSVVSAANATMAMAQALNESPDLILLDVAMPPMDGLTFLFLLRETPCGKCVPVVVVSGQSDANTVERARALGVEDYMVKSHFKTSELLEVVRKRLARVRAGVVTPGVRVSPSETGEEEADVGGKLQ